MKLNKKSNNFYKLGGMGRQEGIIVEKHGKSTGSQRSEGNGGRITMGLVGGMGAKSPGVR